MPILPLQMIKMDPLNPFNMTEEQITEQIKDKHSPKDQYPFDVDSLFIIVANILKRSTRMVDVLTGVDHEAGQADGNEEKSNPKDDFKVPICILKNIGCELLGCKDPDAKIAHETAQKILEKLRHYSWWAKAVLTLAAFAKEYGDHLQFHHVRGVQENLRHQLSKSLESLTGSSILAKKPAVDELNNLIKETLKMTRTINKLEKLSINSSEDIARFVRPDEVDYYWIIMTVVACANKLTILISDEKKQHDLSPYSEKIKNISSNCREKLDTFETPKMVENISSSSLENLDASETLKEEKVHYYKLSKLSKLSKSPTEVKEFLEVLLLAPPASDHVQLIDGSNDYKTVDIDVLKKKKKVLLVVSRPDISDADIDILRRIQSEKIKNGNIEDQYAIVWVPISDDNLPDPYKLGNGKEALERLVKSKEIQWYTSNNLISHKGSLRFLKDNWQVESTRPIVVLMDLLQGKIEKTNAFYAMGLLGLEAFPFDKETEQRKFREMTWIYTLFKDSLNQYGDLANWVENEKYILLHGGTDKKWADQIKKKVDFINTELKNINIKVENFEINQENVENQFWSGVDTLLSAKLQKVEYDFATQQLKRLSSYKQAQGWFVLNKGSTTVVVGSRETFLRAVEDINKWKENARQMTLEAAFKEYHEKISDRYIVQYLSGDGKLLIKKMDCPTCGQYMEMSVNVTYKCSHPSKASTTSQDLSYN